MSTKIYHGKRVWAESLDEAIHILRAPREAMEAQLEKEVLKSTILKAVNVMDSAIMKTVTGNVTSAIERLDSNPMSIVWLQSLDKNNEDRESEKEYLEITKYLYPVKLTDEKGSYYLFTYHGENKFESQYLNLMESKVEEYAYFNNTDKPDELTEDQWDRRSSDWDKALLAQTGIPEREGMGLIVAKEHNILYRRVSESEFENAVQELHTVLNVDARLKKYINDYRINLVFTESKLQKPDADIFQLFFAAERSVRKGSISSGIEQKSQEFIHEISGKLPEINQKLLMTQLGDILDNLSKSSRLKP